jgi:hypothetical protein
MTGALTQIMSYGSEDMYLTASPQITFFKIAYRRYTSFAIQTHFQTPDSPLDFGGECSFSLDTFGDLISNAYLAVDLPAVKLARKTLPDDSLSIINTYLRLIDEYLAANYKAARILASIISATHLKPIRVVNAFTDPSIVSPIKTTGDAVRDWLNQGKLSEVIEYEKVSIYRLLQKIENLNVVRYLIPIYNEWGLDDVSRRSMLDILEKRYYMFVKDFRDEILDKKRAAEKRIENVKHFSFAWGKEIGTALIEKTEFHLGGNLIDSQTGEFLSSYEKLFLNQEQTEIYNELIGNVPEIYQYESRPKAARRLIIPLRYCFTLRPSSALPIIAMKNAPPIIDFKIRSLGDVCQFSPSLTIDDLHLHLGSVQLIIDHIYLDQEEKMRYYKYSHEYLIETAQQTELSGQYGTTLNIKLPFVGPLKYLAWWVKPDDERFLSGDSYLSTENSVINMGIHDRVSDRMTSAYYELIQPYYHFAKALPPGFNVYSFALNPNEGQNTGTLNASRLRGFQIRIHLSKNIGIPVTIVVFTMSYNVLRFYSGIGGLAFRRSG